MKPRILHPLGRTNWVLVGFALGLVVLFIMLITSAIQLSRLIP